MYSIVLIFYLCFLKTFLPTATAYFPTGYITGYHRRFIPVYDDSPCPKYFYYGKNFVNNKQNKRDFLWRAIITVPFEVPLVLKVKLYVPLKLTARYQGILEINENKDKLFKRMLNETIPTVQYHFYFQQNLPVPRLVRLEANSKVLCICPQREFEPKGTYITREHVLSQTPLKLEAHVPAETSEVDNNFESDDIVLPEVCGRQNGTTPLILNGNLSLRGDWPWMVPLFVNTELGLQFRCSAVLITRKLLITAAQCVRTKFEGDTDKNDLVAFVGRYDIKDWTEDRCQPRGISEIHVHRDYNPHKLHSDVAILKLTKPVTLTRFVQPVCLWSGDEDLNKVVGRKGIVSGWGMDGSGQKISRIPRLAVVTIVSQNECIERNRIFIFRTSERTLCAGYRNDAASCKGNSGGGLVLSRRIGGILTWVLRGIVSLPLPDEHGESCNAHEYVVFTDVAKFQSWISEIKKSSD